MDSRFPQRWTWSQKPSLLSAHAIAPDEIGFYELGFVVAGRFEPQYAGRAKGVTLRQRLRQHFLRSHNPHVRKNAKDLHFRCKVLATPELAAYVEAVSIAAFEYPWNRRNEWAMHWVLES